MINLVIGLVLLLVTLALYVWVLPGDGKTTRIPNKWGFTTLLPLFVTCLGIAGFVLIAKSLVS